MKALGRVMLIMSILFSISSLTSHGNVVEAAPCYPGNHASYDKTSDKWKCVENGSEGAGSEGLGENKLTIDEGMPGGEEVTWAYFFVDFLINLATVVAYATEVIAMIMIAYASYVYTTSEGEPRKLRQAKMYVMYAFIGMFMGAFSLVIAKLLGGVF